MQLRLLDGDDILVEQIGSVVLRMLCSIAVSANVAPGSKGAARLFSSPTRGVHPDFDEDWKEFVQPDLRVLFQSCLEVIADDLRALAPAGGLPPYSLRIPAPHLRSWIHGLNQARLAIA